MPLRIVLASASAVRLATLREAGYEVEARPVDIDETPLPGESVEDCVQRLALAKLAASPGEGIVIACDTLGTYEGQLLGKPADPQEAGTVLSRLQGQSIRYVTACAMRTAHGTAHRIGEATVHVAPMTRSEIVRHVATGEPLRAAGGINVRGLGAAFVTRIDGDPGCAIGISPRHVWEMLAELGVPLTEHWT